MTTGHRGASVIRDDSAGADGDLPDLPEICPEAAAAGPEDRDCVGR